MWELRGQKEVHRGEERENEARQASSVVVKDNTPARQSLRDSAALYSSR